MQSVVNLVIIKLEFRGSLTARSASATPDLAVELCRLQKNRNRELQAFLAYSKGIGMTGIDSLTGIDSTLDSIPCLESIP